MKDRYYSSSNSSAEAAGSQKYFDFFAAEM